MDYSEDCKCKKNDNLTSFSKEGKSKASVFHWIQKRKQSDMVMYPNKMLKSYVTRKLPQIFQANDFDMGTIDKIFASHWLDERNVVYGTKCNNVRVRTVHIECNFSLASALSSNLTNH